jgi:hypothetical protein
MAGWERYFFVRPDVLKSPEGPTIEKLLVLIQKSETSNRKDFAERDWRNGGKLRPKEHKPKTLSEKEFISLSEKLQRYFDLRLIRHKRFGNNPPHIERVYVFKYPWKFVSRVRPWYMTHRGIPNSEAESMSKFLSHKLWGPDYKYRHFLRYTGDYYNRWDDWGHDWYHSGPSEEWVEE